MVLQCRQRPGSFKKQGQTMRFGEWERHLARECPHVGLGTVEWKSDENVSAIPYGLLIRPFVLGADDTNYRSPLECGLLEWQRAEMARAAEQDGGDAQAGKAGVPARQQQRADARGGGAKREADNMPEGDGGMRGGEAAGPARKRQRADGKEDMARGAEREERGHVIVISDSDSEEEQDYTAQEQARERAELGDARARIGSAGVEEVVRLMQRFGGDATLQKRGCEGV
jgi:hypothetical protein